MKKIKLLLLYVRDYLIFTGIISFLSFYVFINMGIYALTALFWFKLATSFYGLYIHQKRKAKELFFYMNNGFGKQELLIYALIIDLVFCITGISILVNWRP
ncbi:MAG: hypothetical protein AB8G15_12975 [Saprospiraceae bacterium]